MEENRWKRKRIKRLQDDKEKEKRKRKRTVRIRMKMKYRRLHDRGG